MLILDPPVYRPDWASYHSLSPRSLGLLQHPLNTIPATNCVLSLALAFKILPAQLFHHTSIGIQWRPLIVSIQSDLRPEKSNPTYRGDKGDPRRKGGPEWGLFDPTAIVN